MKSKVENIKSLSKTKFLNMYEIDYKNKVGNLKKWSCVSRADIQSYKERIIDKKEYKDAVLIVPYHIEKDKLVLIKQYRVPVNSYIYEVPAGLIDDNEDINECVKRELLEETGLELVEIKKAFKDILLCPGVVDENTDIVFCTCKGEVSKKYLEEDEELEVVLCDRNDIYEHLDKDIKMDMKTLFAIEIFKNIGKEYWEK